MVYWWNNNFLKQVLKAEQANICMASQGITIERVDHFKPPAWDLNPAKAIKFYREAVKGTFS